LMWWQAGVEFIRATSELLSAQYEITSAEWKWKIKPTREHVRQSCSINNQSWSELRLLFYSSSSQHSDPIRHNGACKQNLTSGVSVYRYSELCAAACWVAIVGLVGVKLFLSRKSRMVVGQSTLDILLVSGRCFLDGCVAFLTVCVYNNDFCVFPFIMH
jgi:hypothetical protein